VTKGGKKASHGDKRKVYSRRTKKGNITLGKPINTRYRKQVENVLPDRTHQAGKVKKSCRGMKILSKGNRRGRKQNDHELRGKGIFRGTTKQSTDNVCESH